MRNIKNRRNLNIIERERIVHLKDILNTDKFLFNFIIVKYLQLNADDNLNSKGEFYQTYDDIRNSMVTGLNDKTIREQLKRLTSSGYITYKYKSIENDLRRRKAIHLGVTSKTINLIISTDEESNLSSKQKYELLQEVRYSYKEKKEFTPEVFNTKKPNPTKESVLSDSKDFKSSDELEPTKKETTQPEPPKEATEPIKVVQWMTFENNNVNNDKIELFIKHLDNPKVKAMLKDLNVSTDDIRYYYSGGYKRGLKKYKDNIKDSLDIIHNQILQPLEGKPIIF